MSVGQIAQLIIPADGLGNPLYMVPDWTRGRLFGFGASSIRRYSLSMVTQSPAVSVNTTGYGSFSALPDVDLVTGNIIGSWLTANGSLARKINPVTLALLDTFGASTAAPVWPASFWYPQQFICVSCGTLANPNNQIGYAFFKETAFKATVGAIRVSDQFTQAGFYQAVVSGSVDSRGTFCRGASGPTGASIFGSWDTTTPAAPTIPLYGVFVAPGAELYDPNTWPTTNASITSSTIGTIAAASVDATWSNLACVNIGYDQSDGNVLMVVTTTDAVTNKNYLIKINSTTAAVMWSLAIASVGAQTHVSLGLYSGGVAPILNSNAAAWTVDSAAGTQSSLTVGGLSTNFSSLLNSYAGVTSGLYVWDGLYNQASSANSPVPVSGTPTTFTGPALISGFFTAIPAAANVQTADLWFSPTTDFIDLSVKATRRLFISQQAAPLNLGATGATPTGNTPPVFFSRTTGALPDTFATNLGNGGSFVLSGGDLGNAVTSPPCSTQTTTTNTPPSKGVGVTGDYRNGKLYAFNMDTLTDAGSQRRWVRSWRAMKEPSSAATRFDALRVDMETGAQVPVAAKPQVMLRYSDDGGHTWSNPRIMAVGALGQTSWSVRATRLGSTGRNSASDRIFELSSSDQFKVAIVGADVEGG